MSINTQKILGTLVPQQQPYRYGRRSDGRWSNVIYASLSESQINSIAASADALGINYEYSNNFGSRSEITLEYNWNFINSGFNSAATESEETWEIVPNKAMKDLLDSRNPLVLAAAQTEVQLLKSWKRQNTLETNLVDSKTGKFVIPTISSTPFSSAGIQLAKAIYDSVEQVEVPAPVLTHSKVVTAQYIYPAQFTNIGKIFSTATLISAEPIPSAVLFDFPHDTDPGAIPIPGTSISQLFLYGWIKNSPSVRQVAKRKWSITQTWDYGLWLMNLYGGTRL